MGLLVCLTFLCQICLFLFVFYLGKYSDMHSIHHKYYYTICWAWSEVLDPTPKPGLGLGIGLDQDSGAKLSTAVWVLSFLPAVPGKTRCALSLWSDQLATL